MEKTGCKIICGAPTTLVVKGLMMMMMMHSSLSPDWSAACLVQSVCFTSASKQGSSC